MGDVKNDGVTCAVAQKVVNKNVRREEGKPGLNLWWMAKAGIVLMGFVPPLWHCRPYARGALLNECPKWDPR